jgi:hypothetical protein
MSRGFSLLPNPLPTTKARVARVTEVDFEAHSTQHNSFSADRFDENQWILAVLIQGAYGLYVVVMRKCALCIITNINPMTY